MTNIKEVLAGEYQSLKAARAFRETVAGILKARYDSSTDVYSFTDEARQGHLIIKEISRSNVQLLLIWE